MVSLSDSPGQQWQRWHWVWPSLLAIVYLALIPVLTRLHEVQGVTDLLVVSAVCGLLAQYARYNGAPREMGAAPGHASRPLATGLPAPLGFGLDALRRVPAIVFWLPLPAVLSWVAAEMARVDPPAAHYDLAFGLWGVALALFVAIPSVPLAVENRHRLSALVRAIPWPEVAAVAFIIAVAFAVRFIALSDEPGPFWADEGDDGIGGLEVARGVRNNFFDMGIQTVQPTIYYATMGLPFKLFGPSILWARLPTVIVGTVTVPLLYLLLREVFSRRVALVGAAFVAVFQVHVHYSRMAFPNAYDAFFAILVLYFAFRSIRTSAFVDFALTGLATGLAYYFFMGGRVVPLVLLVLLAFMALRTRGAFVWRNFWGLAVLFTGFVIAFLPAALYYDGTKSDDSTFGAFTSGTFTSRWETQNIFDTGWLDKEKELTGRSETHVLWDQFQHTLGAFVVYGDTDLHYNSRVPYLDAVSSALLVIGGVYALFHLFQPRFFALYTLFLLTVIFGGTLLGPPVGSNRMLATTAVSAAFVALGLIVAADAAAKLVPRLRQVAPVAVGGVVLVIAVMNLSFYFGTYLPSKNFGRGLHLPAAAVADQLEPYDSSYALYLFDTGGLTVRDGALKFREWDRVLVDVREDGTGKTFIEGRPINPEELVASREVSENALFLVPIGRSIGQQDHTDALEVIKRTCPPGVKSDVFRLGNSNEIEYVWYEVKHARECVRTLQGSILPVPHG